MASRFFLSIPSSIAVKEPYEEVFSLFTTETPDTPWSHNRSVSQQSSLLELELDFTPAPSPAVNNSTTAANRQVSEPESRPGSYFASISAAKSSGGDDVGSNGPLIESGLRDAGDLNSTSSSPLSPPPPKSNRGPDSHSANSTSIPAKAKSPATRALLGSRKSSASRTSGPGSISGPTAKKPVVIHQSLSTLSQPGQTGTVVWDSSILMSKFLLSIKDLTMGCYRVEELQRQSQETRKRRIRKQQKDQVRNLEEQAEHLAVSEEGDLKEVEVTNETEERNKRPEGPGAGSQDQWCGNGRNSNDSDGSCSSSGSDDSSDNNSDDSSDLGGEQEGEEEGDTLVFDPAETTVLELGSGCGLLGIVMAELCQELLLTDQKPVLPLLVKNLRKNLDKKHFDQDSSSYGAISTSTSNISPTSTTSSAARKKKDRVGDTPDTNGRSAVKPCHIQVQELVWGQDLDQDIKRGLGFDYVIATDVIYNESVIPKLVRTLTDLCIIRERLRQEYSRGHGDSFDRLQELLPRPSFSNYSYSDGERGEASRKQRQRKMLRMLNRTVVLIAQELRTDYVHLAFLEGLEEAGFRVVRIPREMMDLDYQSGYVIYACFLKNKHSDSRED